MRRFYRVKVYVIILKYCNCPDRHIIIIIIIDSVCRIAFLPGEINFLKMRCN